MENWAVFVPLLVALVGPIGAYLIAARRLSGRIASSEASELWAESRSIREHLQARLAAANEREAKARERIGVLEDRVDELEGELRAAQAEVEELRRRLARGDI